MDIKKYLIKRDDAALFIIDIQERLFVAMKEKVRENIEKNTSILIETARAYNIPVVVSEQYKKGLGPTIPSLAGKLPDAPFLEKIHFDCMKEEILNKKIIEMGKRTIIIAGIEAHVCVFQTALSLIEKGFNVIIASDAVGSRRKHDWSTALNSLAGAGAVIYPTETISFLILEKAGTPEFKAVSPMFK